MVIITHQKRFNLLLKKKKKRNHKILQHLMSYLLFISKSVCDKNVYDFYLIYTLSLKKNPQNKNT